jgi:Cyclic nucleotide-binding domain
VGKPANNGFDPKAFLAKVGAGKTILKFEKNQHVFTQGDVADAVFYIQQGRVKLTVLSTQGKEAVVGILEPGQFFGEGVPQWPFIAYRDHNGDGRMRDHLNNQRSDDCHPSYRAEIFRAVHGVSLDTEQPS